MARQWGDAAGPHGDATILLLLFVVVVLVLWNQGFEIVKFSAQFGDGGGAALPYILFFHFSLQCNNDRCLKILRFFEMRNFGIYIEITGLTGTRKSV